MTSCFDRSSLTFRKATMLDIAETMEIYRKVREYIRSRGSDQWNANYPGMHNVLQDLDNEELYVSVLGKKVVGTVTLSVKQLPEYSNVQWLRPMTTKPLIMYRFAIATDFWNFGIGSCMLSESEKLARQRNFDSIRLTVYSLNTMGLQFYKRYGYMKMPETIRLERHRHPSYCMEKLLHEDSPEGIASGKTRSKEEK